MKVTDFNKLAEKFFELKDLRNEYQSRAAQALCLWHLLEGAKTTLEAKIAYCKKVLIKKGGEYSSDEDKLKNFKNAASLSHSTSMKCAEGFCLKHEVSINDILRGDLDANDKLLREKFGDYMNYQVLMCACSIDAKSQANMDCFMRAFEKSIVNPDRFVSKPKHFIHAERRKH